MKNNNRLFLLAVFFLQFLTDVCYSQIADQPRGMYVDKFITLYTDAAGKYQLDPNLSILGVDQNPSDGVFEKETELLNFCKENRITYLTLYDMRNLTNGDLLANNPSLYNYLNDRLCNFMTEAKNNYCINSFGAVGFTSASFQALVSYNSNFTLTSFTLTIAEKALLGNNAMLINAIESASITPTDPLFYTQQLFRFAIGIYRRNSFSNTQGHCPDFDVLNMEYEFWNRTDDGDGITSITGKWNKISSDYLPSLKVIALAAGVKSEIYLGYLFDTDANKDANNQVQSVANFIDGTNGSPMVDRLLLHTYLHNPDVSFSYPLYNTRINLFRQPSTKNSSNVRPIFSAEDLNYYHGDGDFFGKWFTEVSSSPFSTTTPNYIHNLFSAERLYYNDWRTPGATHGDANVSSTAENHVKPGATQWFTSSMMLGQLDHPALFYTNDAPKCTSSTTTTIPVDLNYQGPLEDGLQYTFTLSDFNGVLETPVRNIGCNSGTSNDYAVSYQANNLGTNLCLPGYDLSTASAKNPYTATLTLTKNYPNSDGNCNYSYSFSKKIWTTNSGLNIEVIGNYTFNGTEYEICENQPLVLAGNVSGTVFWYKVDSPNDILVGSGSNFHPTSVGLNEYYYSKTSGSCIGNSPHVFINIKNNPPASISAYCGSSTSNVTLVPSSGSSYTWNDGSNASAITVGSGTYSVTIDQGNGCSRSAKYTTMSKPSIALVSGDACNGGNAIIKENTIDNSSGNYSFQWFLFEPVTGLWNAIVGATTQQITINSYGQYRVTASIGTKCRTSNSFTHGFYISAISAIQANCQGSNTGQISLTMNPSGGTYTYLWSNSANTASISNLSPGTYSVVVTQVGGSNCTLSASVSLNSALTISTSSTNVLCNSGATGTATANPSGGTGPFFYNWNSNPIQTTQTASNLIAGSFVVTVTDINGCTGTSSVTISEPTALHTYITSSDPLCNNNTNGSATANVYGGTSPYSYLWSNTFSTATISGLSAGSYQVTVTDNKGCHTNSSVTLNNPQPINAFFSTSSICSGSNLLLNLSGTNPWTVNYNNGSSQTINCPNSVYTFVQPSVGTYTLNTVTDYNGCTLNLSSTAVVNPNITANASIALTTGTNPTCSSATSVLTATTNVPNPTYQWKSGATIIGTNSTISSSAIPFGTNQITCTITSNASCVSGLPVVSNTIFFTKNQNPTVSISAPSSSCIGAQLCTNPQNFSSYLWTGSSEVTSCINANIPQTYSVIATDANQCTTSAQYNFSAMNMGCCGNYTTTLTQTIIDNLVAPFELTGQYNLNSNLNITKNVTLKGCTLAIASGMTITVQSGKTFTITDQVGVPSWLYSCGDMWGGIINSGGVVIINNNSLIQDAISAISSANGSRISVTGSRFDKNYYDISLANGSFPPSQTTIHGNLFDCSSHISKAPHINQITRAHIQLDNVTDLVVGDATRNSNTFLKGAVGINANFSSIYVFHNDFNPQEGKSCAIRGKGAGNRKEGNMIIVGGSGSNEYNTFANAGWGVQCNGVEKVNSYYNSFNNCFRGISLTNIRESISNNNVVKNFYNGIEIYDAILPDPVDLCCPENHIVAYNSFNPGLNYGVDLVSYGNTSIDIRNKVPQFTPVTVSNNSILNSAIGIHFLNSNGSKAIDGNTYDSQIPFDQSTNDHYGIWVQNSNNVKVIGNTVLWSGPFASGSISRDLLQNQKGISVARSFKCVFEENAIRNFAAGFNVFDDCTNDNLYCNLMDNCYNGLFLDDQNPNNRMTDQGVPVFTGVFYEHDLSTTWNNRWKDNIDNKVDGLYNQSAFRWLYSDAPYDPEYAPIPSGPMITPLSCLLSLAGCTTPTSFVDDEKRKEAFGKAVGDSSETEIDSVEYAHGDKAFFYKQAKDNPEYLNLGYPTDVLYQLKYNLIAQTNIGKFEDIKASLSSKEIQEAISKLNSMQNLNSIDENNKFISELIALGYDVDLDMDSDTIALVTSIALQHPFYGGEAVYMARAMLRIDVHDQLPQYRKANRPKGVKSITNSVVVYPNPTTDIVTIFSNLPFVESELRIYNSYGKELRLLKISDQQNMFNFSLDEFPSGIYSIKISSKNVLLKQDKIVLIK